MLSDALRRIAAVSRSIGIAAVLLQAKDENAKRFYMACAEFIEFPEDSRTLFLPVETLIAAYGREAPPPAPAARPPHKGEVGV